MPEHTLILRVYVADTDSVGVVHHANYLKFFEYARSEALRDTGIQLPWLIENFGVQFAVSKLDITYRKPAKLDDKLMIITKVQKVGPASVEYYQAAYLDDQDGPLLCDANLTLVCVNKELQATKLPDSIRAEII